MSPGASSQPSARLAGLLYLVVIAAGVFAEMAVRGGLVVSNDAVATARNIMANETLYRLGFAAELVALMCNIPLAVIFYDLFKVVDRRATLLAVFASLVGTAIESADLLNHAAPLGLLSGASYLKAIPAGMLQAQAYLALAQFELGFSICLVFFAMFCLALGYLIARSGFMPPLIGIILAFEGVCYLVASFTHILAPHYVHLILPVLMVSALGEISLCLWLLVMGVNVAKWTARASAM